MVRGQIIGVLVAVVIACPAYAGKYKQIDTWQGIIYPYGDTLNESTHKYSPMFNNLEDCKNWVLKNQVNPEDKYSCGKNCKDDKYGLQTCKEVIRSWKIFPDSVTFEKNNEEEKPTSALGKTTTDTKQGRDLSECFDLKENKKKKTLHKEQIDKTENFADLQEGLQALQLMAKSFARKRKNNCLKAFGNEQFCNCLNGKLPMAIDFIEYIQLITSTKDKMGYKSLSTKDKEIVDKVLKVRDQCVEKIH